MTKRNLWWWWVATIILLFSVIIALSRWEDHSSSPKSKIINIPRGDIRCWGLHGLVVNQTVWKCYHHLKIVTSTKGNFIQDPYATAVGPLVLFVWTTPTRCRLVRRWGPIDFARSPEQRDRSDPSFARSCSHHSCADETAMAAHQAANYT